MAKTRAERVAEITQEIKEQNILLDQLKKSQDPADKKRVEEIPRNIKRLEARLAMANLFKTAEEYGSELQEYYQLAERHLRDGGAMAEEVIDAVKEELPTVIEPAKKIISKVQGIVEKYTGGNKADGPPTQGKGQGGGQGRGKSRQASTGSGRARAGRKGSGPASKKKAQTRKRSGKS